MPPKVAVKGQTSLFSFFKKPLEQAGNTVSPSIPSASTISNSSAECDLPQSYKLIHEKISIIPEPKLVEDIGVVKRKIDNKNAGVETTGTFVCKIVYPSYIMNTALCFIINVRFGK